MEVAESGESTDSVQAAVVSCPVPAKNTGSACDLGNGSFKFQVTLASGQQYVEVFARQNGIQNVATAITQNGTTNADGTKTYSLTRSGYSSNDSIEYRFYSYLPNSPGVFTPGPTQSTWYKYTKGGFTTVPAIKDAAVVLNNYSNPNLGNTKFGTAQSVDIGEYHLTSEGLFGFALVGIVQGVAVKKAELIVTNPYMPGGPTTYYALNRVTSPWLETEVTWNTKPSYSFIREISLTANTVNVVDVTAQVQQAVAAGNEEISFALAPSKAPTGTGTDNVFIDAREKPLGNVTKLHIVW
jgi:hypothetical protein